MHEDRVISRTIPSAVPRKHMKIKGSGAATKGTKWDAVADQTVDTAQKQPVEYVSNIKKVS